MHYDPYESRRSKKSRLISNILLIIIGLLFIWGIYNLVFHQTKIKKFEFDRMTVAASEDDSDEFLRLQRAASAKGAKRERNSDFTAAYPAAAALLDMDTDVYSADKPYIYFGSRTAVVAQTVLSSENDCRDLAVAVLSTEIERSEGTVKISCDEVNMFMLRYNTRSGEIEYLPYSEDDYRLDVYSVGFSLVGDGFEKSEYSLEVTDFSLVPEDYKPVYDTVGRDYGSPKRDGNVISGSSKCSNKKAALTVDVSGDAPNFIDRFTLLFTGENAENAELSFTAN